MKSSQRYEQKEAQFKAQFRPRATVLRDALCARIPNAPKGITRFGNESLLIALEYGSLAGSDAVGDLADYLEILANKLPMK
jgi:hypothetical protein